jgi:peptidylprolyl isomerase
MRLRHLTLAILAALALALSSCGDDDDSGDGGGSNEAAATEQAPVETTAEPSGALAEKPKIAKRSGDPPTRLQVKDLVNGKGEEAGTGDVLTVNYVGVNYSNGKEFDTSFGKAPFQLELGAGAVIPGWDQGLVGMKVGTRRELTIPPDLAYGPQGSPPDIGPNETLVFVVDLLGIN